MAVADSSILIHLSRINKISLLKKCFNDVMITHDIYDEVKTGTGASEIEKACKSWINVEKPKNSNQINDISRLESIEKADASIIVLAEEKKEILLSNDYNLIMVARSKGIECWWLTTFILRCLKKKIITKKEAEQILLELINSGLRLSNEVYAAILREIDNL
jgi:predicted nucleic acid-binding protein